MKNGARDAEEIQWLLLHKCDFPAQDKRPSIDVGHSFWKVAFLAGHNEWVVKPRNTLFPRFTNESRGGYGENDTDSEKVSEASVFSVQLQTFVHSGPHGFYQRPSANSTFIQSGLYHDRFYIAHLRCEFHVGVLVQPRYQKDVDEAFRLEV